VVLDPRATRAVVACLAFIPFATPAARGAEATPLIGCYERLYDAAHLASHPGQIVLRVRLGLEKSTIPVSDHPPFAADAYLDIWVKKNKRSFGSLSACEARGDGLGCTTSLSAAETDRCKTKTDGVRHCRIDYASAGLFHVAGKPDGVLLTIGERLELDETGSEDSGPYLYLSPDNRENHAFLLKRADPSACKR
jgi:hypothetical protein